jgi:filamentous hemagglutinin
MRLNNQLAADEIANGHALDKHVIEQNEFGDSITTQQQFGLLPELRHFPASR